MARARLLPGQKSLLPAEDPAGEVIRSLRTWPDQDLYHLARAVGYELIRRNRAMPAALPIGEVMAVMGSEVAV